MKTCVNIVLYLPPKPPRLIMCNLINFKKPQNIFFSVYSNPTMVCQRNASVRLKMSLFLVATLVNTIAGLPSMWLQNDIIGNHFGRQHLDPTLKAR